MTLPAHSSSYSLEQRKFSVFAARRVQKLWDRVGNDFDSDWVPLIADAAGVIVLAQKAAAVTSADYTPATLFETDTDALPVGTIDTQGFAGVNRYGEPVTSVLTGATTYAKNLVRDGATVTDALLGARNWLTSTTLTMVSDTGRSVVAADVAQRPAIGGYVRVLTSPSCPRCIVLAGKWFRWNEGFLRHPRCDCKHVPARDEEWARAEGFITDPYDAFKSLSPRKQDELFGTNQAEAIRQGADIYRVVNIAGVPGSAKLARGLANINGRSGWQGRRYGTPSKVTIDEIFKIAGNDREKAAKLLLDAGYITGPQVGGGNIKGRFYEGYAGTMGRGGTRKGATYSFKRAKATGVRDPYAPDGVSLDSATQTAAERRLHYAYLNMRAVDEGRNPFANNTKRTPLTPRVRKTVEAEYRLQIALLPQQPRQVQRLAALLGMS